MIQIKQELHQNNFQTLPHSIYPFLSLSFSLLVCLSIGPTIAPSVTHFFGPRKNGWKGSKMTLHISAGFIFQSFTLNLSFNFPYNFSFTILLSKSSFKIFFSKPFWQYFVYNFSSIIFPSQYPFHNLSQSFFHNLYFTIFLSQSLFHNLFESLQNLGRIVVPSGTCYPTP